MSKRGENVYKRKDGRWEGRVLKPKGGYAYVYGKSYREVKEKKTLFSQSKEQFFTREEENLPASEQFKQWLCKQEGYVRKSTYASYESCISNYILPFFDSDIDCLSEFQSNKFVHMIAQRENLSVAYRKKIICIFKTAINNMVKENKLPPMPYVQVKIQDKKLETIPFFSQEEQKNIEKSIFKLDDFRALGILLCFYTGIRLGELCALRWENIDFESGVMLITATAMRIKKQEKDAAKTALITSPPKTKNAIRAIPVPAFMLKKLQENQPDKAAQDYYIFSGRNCPMEPRTMQRIFHKVLKNAEVSPRKYHAIRHTFATRALELGVDIKTLSELLGHSSVTITLNIYAHSMLEQKKIAIEKMNSLYLSHGTTGFRAVDSAVS